MALVCVQNRLKCALSGLLLLEFCLATSPCCLGRFLSFHQTVRQGLGDLTLGGGGSSGCSFLRALTKGGREGTIFLCCLGYLSFLALPLSLGVDFVPGLGKPQERLRHGGLGSMNARLGRGLGRA